MATALMIAFVVFLLGGVPIAFAMGLIGATGIIASGKFAYLELVPNLIFGGLDSFVISAIPFFILAGSLMNAGGVSQRLIRFAVVMIGHLPGGLGLVTVVSCMFFSGISGAASADAAAVGMVMIPAMERAGYGREYSAALVASASLMGPIIPPSIVFVIYAVIAEVSIGDMFLAGVVPGLIMGIGLVCMTVWRSSKYAIPPLPKASRQERIDAAIPAAPALALPFIIIGGIVFGFVTPTEAAALAVLIALLLGFFVYRELTVKALPGILGTSALISAAVLLIVATSNVFSWVLTAERIPQQVLEALVALTKEPWLLLLYINIFLLIVGIFIEGVPAILILTPILLPAAVALGISPIHFGVVMCFNLVIGFITPPVGICLFVVCSVAKVTLEALNKHIWPFVGLMVIVLMLITYIPSLVMALPNAFR